MADVSKRLTPGERWQPAADALNGYQDAADYVRDLKEGGGAMPDPGVQRQVVIVTVKNRSGRDCARFDVLGISEPIFPPDDDPRAFTSRVGLSGVAPKLSDHATLFVVLLEPAAQDALARACLIGVVPVRLNVVYEWHQFAHLEDERADRLVSDSVGFPVVWKDAKANEDASGNRWALVKIGGPALTMGVWKNQGDPVGPHEHFCITGVDTGHAGTLVGTRPTDRLGPDYAVNGSQQVDSGQYGVYQRTDQVWAAYGGTSPEPGDYLGPIPGSGLVAKTRPPVCRVLGIADAEHGIAQTAPCRPAQRFKLLEPLYECGTADAQIMGRSGYDYIVLTDYATDSVSDTLGVVAQSPLALRDSRTGKLYIPADKCLNARIAHDPSVFWEVLDLGECRCAGSSSSSAPSQPSLDSTSINTSSQSDVSSGSDVRSSGESSGDNGSSGGDLGSSGSASGGSQGSGDFQGSSQGSIGSQGGIGSSGSGSDKSTAIVPAGWSPTGFTALFIAECPEVRFDDVMIVETDQAQATFPMDSRFVEVCEPGTIEVCGCAPDAAVLVGAKAEGQNVRVSLAADSRSPITRVRVVLRLTGIRRGFHGHRFPDRTRTQFEANERFIRSAYPDEQ